jgi:hypothetical protein
MSMSASIEAVSGDLPKGKHVMCCMDHTGDTKIMWSKDNQDEVDVARRTFDDMKKKGYTARLPA